MSDEVRLSALHDVQKFVVEKFVDWSINTDGEFDLRVRWRGHDDEEEDTWQPLEQLVVDVPVMVAKYVKETDHQQLSAVHRECVRRS